MTAWATALDQCNLFIAEPPYLLVVRLNGAEQGPLLAQRHCQRSVNPAQVDDAPIRRDVTVGVPRTGVGDMNDPLAAYKSCQWIGLMWRKRTLLPQKFGQARLASERGRMKAFSIVNAEMAVSRIA